MMVKLKDIGRSLQLPVSIFPLAALLNGLGYLIERMDWRVLNVAAVLLKSVGTMILNEMPLIFAVGIAYGLGKEKKGTYAVNALFCFLMVKGVLSFSSPLSFFIVSAAQAREAFEHINNQFIGILVGVLSVVMMQFIKRRKFGMNSSGALLFCAAGMLALSLLLYFVWPFCYVFLIEVGERISGLGAAGAGIYGFLNRLLLPIGMHHTLNSVFWFDVVGINDIGNFWSGKGILGVTGMYQAGFYPIMMAGVPAMALAMYRTSYTSQKRTVRSFYLSSALASLFTGITEPLEFSFMFQAPLLYLFHCILTGFSLFLCASLQWIAGFSFSAGVIDYLLSLTMPLAHHPLSLLLLFPLFFVLYYVCFTFAIRRFHLHPYGREKESGEEKGRISNRDINAVARELLQACGGEANIIHVTCCITRIRVELKDPQRFDFQQLKDSGAIEYQMYGNEAQIVYGVQAEYIYDILQNYCLS